MSRVTLSGQGLTRFKPSSIKIKFHDSTPNTFKPGLTFVAKIIVTTQDNKPVDRASITVTPNINTDSVSSVFEVAGGIAEFTYVVSSSTTYLSLEIGAMLEYKVASNFQFSLVRYQVLARGGIVTQKAQQLDTLATRISLSFVVTHDMAPTAQIIAYVIKSDGEVVADSLSVSVSNAFENAVSVWCRRLVWVSEKNPGENVALTVTATPDSFVAVAAVDYSVTLLADTNDITQADVIDELQSYDTSTPDWDDSPVWAFRRKRRSSIWWPWSPGGQDAYQIFDNAGVVVLTDTTVYKDEHLHRYFGGGCADCGDLVAIQSKERDGESPPAPGELLEPERVRTFFPETWPDGTAVFASKVPDTITTWVASAFAVNNVTGLGVPANTAECIAYVTYAFFYTLACGSQDGLRIECLYREFFAKVVVELEENDDLLPVSYDVFTNEVEPVNSPERFGLSQRVTVTGNNGTTVVFAVKPRTVGRILIRVKATSRVAADAVERQLLVVPEGRAVDYTHNVFIQLDESG
ncbi:CD109 antigen-like [Corticium candelabrum]|uniref:CD109 antigen-like n=1 Tax=Corticium candelabrum TaxID=121492 RepID=UPI002E2550F9|nr:CD109 antigen-like [Corticium candelabrum]